MSQNSRAESLLDLNFLTEEEQNAIVLVLSRDAELRSQEEGRIHKLQRSVSDQAQLKILTGEWFSEARSKRHRDKQFGTDIVRASIRKRKKQFTGEKERKESAGREDAEDLARNKHLEQSSSASEKHDRNLDKPVSQSSPKESAIQNHKQSAEQPPIGEQGKHKLEVSNTDHRVEQSQQNAKIPNTNHVVQQSPRQSRTPSTGNQMEQSPRKSKNSGTENDMAHSPRKSDLSGSEHQMARSPGGLDVPNAGHHAEQSTCQVKVPETDVLPQKNNATPKLEKSKEHIQPVLVVSESVESDPELSDNDLGPGTNSNHIISSKPGPTGRSSSMASLQSSNTLGGSMMSLYGDGDFGSVEVKGLIQFSLRYDDKKNELHILVVQCQDLAEAKKQRSDPYVKSYLLPDKSSKSKRKTHVKKKTLSPLFNETLKYKIEKVELQSRTLNLSVWHHDSLGRNLFLGEVEQPLDIWDWSNIQPTWFSLQPRIPVLPMTVSRGKLLLALMYKSPGSEGNNLPPTGELHFWVKEAHGLIPLRSHGVDAFVKCFVLPDDRKDSRQKTRVIKKSLNPVFNHTMVFDGFRSEDLREACAEFTVWDHETFSSSHQLGGVRLSLGTGQSYGKPVNWMDSTPEEVQAWDSMINTPNVLTETVLPLRCDLAPRS